ncbi:MAG: phosphatase PAP2 family protein, partial [Actinomycetota bacterium]
ILDATLPPLSEAASYSRLWMGVAALIAALGGSRGRRGAVAGMAAIGATSAVANIAVKGVANRRRPTSEVPESRRLVHPESTSFPSGHTASAAAFSGVIGAILPGLRVPMNALAAAVGFSRVYTGVHYPGDVAAGWLLGKGIAAVVVRLLRRLDSRTS